MRLLLTSVCLLLLTIGAQAQKNKKFTYTIEKITADSFYLKEQAVGGLSGKKDTQVTYIFLRDTSEYKQVIVGLQREEKRLKQQYEDIKSIVDSLSTRIDALVKLGQQELGLNLKSGDPGKNKSAPAPGQETPAKSPASDTPTPAPVTTGEKIPKQKGKKN